MAKVKDEILTKDVQMYLDKNTVEALGYRSGVGSKIINAIREGNYERVPERLMNKVKTIVRTNEMQGLYKTADCIAFLNAKNDALRHKFMIGITGDTGTGKSYMSLAVSKADNVLYYNCHLKNSARVFFHDILINLKKPIWGNMSELIDRTAEAINDTENPLLIVDEADKMHREIRAAIHTLRDRTIKNMGVMLVGMPSLKNDLIKGKELGKQGFSEFYRRVNIWHELRGLSADEIKTVAYTEGIKDVSVQRDLRRFTSFGELMNEIALYKRLNSN